MRYVDLMPGSSSGKSGYGGNSNPHNVYQSTGNENGANASKGGMMQVIEKDKVLRQSPFDACGTILAGPKVDFMERYNSFFIGI
jgi:hypothetical protein